MRAPTAVELTCADPTAPCPLPNAFLSDPPLQAVIAKTVELGGRGMLSANTSWSAALYRANLDNDIQFVSASAAGAVGYFTNIPQTRRQGFELGLQQRFGPVNLQAAYGFVDATYQSSFLIQSPNNSTANAAGDIQVQSGDQIPGDPAQQLQAARRLAGQRQALYRRHAGICQQPIRTRRQQQPRPERTGPRLYHLQFGRPLPDHRPATGLRAHQQPFQPEVQHRWRAGRELLHADRTSATTWRPRRPRSFNSPGAPFGIWVGIRYDFGKPANSASGAGDNN